MVVLSSQQGDAYDHGPESKRHRRTDDDVDEVNVDAIARTIEATAAGAETPISLYRSISDTQKTTH